MKTCLFLLIFLSSCASIQPIGHSLPDTVDASDALGCELTPQDRDKILSVARPENFPDTRYRKRPRAFPRETDCSHFVHHVYSEAGFPYRFRSSREFSFAGEFQPISPREALPGDIVLYRGHLGIVSDNYKVISATRNRKSIREMDAESFPPLKKGNNVFRYRCKIGLAQK